MSSRIPTKLLLIFFLICFVSAKRICRRTDRLIRIIPGKTAGLVPNPATGAPMKIITGPIIGKVTTTTARVLIEFDTETPLTLILTDPAGVQITASRVTKASVPVPFAFQGLQPNTKYTVTLNDSSIAMTESYFTTLSGESGKLNFAVMSCNDQGIQLSKEPKADLWANLLSRIQSNEVQYLLQTGDQVYMDDPFGSQNATKPYFACMKIINSTSQAQWDDKAPQLLEILRNEYRQTWNIQSIKETLAKVPSLTILDDHQVRDDWGYLPQDSDPISSDYFYGTLARQVYYEYERQLREDVDFSNLTGITQEYYYEVLNDIGFFFVDYRGIRTWNRNFSQMENTQLGLIQTQLIQEVFNPNGGTFANLSNAFFVTPLTMVFLVEAMVKIGYYGTNDAAESWSYAYKDEQAQLLSTLRNWKIARDGREVTILDGDIHIAGYTDIIYDKDDAFLQFTTSSIASSAPGDAAFLGFEVLKEAQNLVNPWTYEHHDWTNKFNYGIVLTKNEDDEAEVGCYLVEADIDMEPFMINDEGSDVSDGEWQAILAGYW